MTNADAAGRRQGSGDAAYTASLNGAWEYAIVKRDEMDIRTARPPERFDGCIAVPFSPESRASGVGRMLHPGELLWYRRQFEVPRLEERRRLLLHFGAVDWECACFVDGCFVGRHTGGYLPFAFDVTCALRRDSSVATVELCVADPSDAGRQPRGKQVVRSGGIWYTGQSGIWGNVWVEAVPPRFITSVRVATDPDSGAVCVEANMSEPGAEATATLLDGERTVAQASAPAGDDATARLELTVGEPRLWGPADPYCYTLVVACGGHAVRRSVAFRSVGVETGPGGIPRFCLNHQPVMLRAALWQGYWEESLMTPPSDEAVVRDIEAMRRAGFNALRVHAKIEGEAFYEACDRLGMLVLQDLVPAGTRAPIRKRFRQNLPSRVPWFRSHVPDRGKFAQFLIGSHRRAQQEVWLREGEESMRALAHHPSVVCWTLFNEGWGQFDARGAVRWAKGIDPTRPVDATSGWFDQGCGDFVSVHDYKRDLRLLHRVLRRMRRKWATGTDGRALILSEFGGIACLAGAPPAGGEVFGYGDMARPEAFPDLFEQLVAKAARLEPDGLSGYVYTQVSDIEEECNGLLSFDRSDNKLAR